MLNGNEQHPADLETFLVVDEWNLPVIKNENISWSRMKFVTSNVYNNHEKHDKGNKTGINWVMLRKLVDRKLADDFVCFMTVKKQHLKEKSYKSNKTLKENILTRETRYRNITKLTIDKTPIEEIKGLCHLGSVVNDGTEK